MTNQIDKAKTDKANGALLVIFFIIGFVIFTMNQCSDDHKAVPTHKVVDYSSLAPKDGYRIQLNSDNPALSKSECIALINEYRSQARNEGQVSVHKPSKVMGGNMTPWCVDNLDGKGIFFNEQMF